MTIITISITFTQFNNNKSAKVNRALVVEEREGAWWGCGGGEEARRSGRVGRVDVGVLVAGKVYDKRRWRSDLCKCREKISKETTWIGAHLERQRREIKHDKKEEEWEDKKYRCYRWRKTKVSLFGYLRHWITTLYFFTRECLKIHMWTVSFDSIWWQLKDKTKTQMQLTNPFLHIHKTREVQDKWTEA